MRSRRSAPARSASPSTRWARPLRLEAFEDYYDPARPKLERVNIHPIPEVEPLAAALEAGDIQIVGGNPVTAELIERFQANPEIEVHIAPRPGFYAIYLNPWRDPMRVPDFNQPLEELLKEPGFQVRAALARALDRDRFIEIGNFGFGDASFGSINPALGFMYDPAIAERSAQRYQPDSARELLAAAGFPNGEGMPPLALTIIPDERRRGQVFADIMQRELGVKIDLDPVDVTVLGERRDRMDFDLLVQNSGGDFDPDDGLVDFMTTDSKFNGNARDKAKYPFGYFSDAEVDRLVAEQSVTPDPAAPARDRAGGQSADLRQGRRAVRLPPDQHARAAQGGQLPGRKPDPGPGGPRPGDGLRLGRMLGGAPAGPATGGCAPPGRRPAPIGLRGMPRATPIG